VCRFMQYYYTGQYFGLKRVMIFVWNSLARATIFSYKKNLRHKGVTGGACATSYPKSCSERLGSCPLLYFLENTGTQVVSLE